MFLNYFSNISTTSVLEVSSIGVYKARDELWQAVVSQSFFLFLCTHMEGIFALSLPFCITLLVSFIVLSLTKGLLSLEMTSVTTTSGRDTSVLTYQRFWFCPAAGDYFVLSLFLDGGPETAALWG